MFIAVKKAHLNPECKEDVYLELPEECNCPPGFCGKLKEMDVWYEAGGISLGVTLLREVRG
eukprot:8416681-Karenia_brevis.AAC.1